MKKLLTMFIDSKIAYTTAAPELEDNFAVLNQWRNFNKVQYRRRRCFKKEL
jgi:hypothetical protein